MSCVNSQETISQLLDRRLDAQQREEVLQHIATCHDCSMTAESMREIRASLQRMQAVPVPPQLASQLRATASRERIRVLTHRSLGERLSAWLDWGRLTLDNLMRPVALPFAGGVLSALVLFSALVPTFAFHRDYANDVPIALFTDPALEEIGYHNAAAEETVLDLTVDERGRVTDVAVPQGKLTPQLQNDLLFYRFAPATAFGSPIRGRVTVTLRQGSGGNHIVVRG